MSEPLFRLSKNEDPEMLAAHASAAATMQEFLSHLKKRDESFRMAKLRFRDPDLSQRLGEDRHFFLWLSSVEYHEEENLLSGVFFEVPRGFEKWHSVGSLLEFEIPDVFDWMIIRDGHAFGGFTVRLTRARLPESERAAYDKYVGITSYEPI